MNSVDRFCKSCKFLTLGAMALVIATIVIAAMVIAESAWAQPADGFSIMISAVEHDNTIEFDKGLLDGFELDYTSAGQGLGIDYQIKLGDASSWVLFYQNSSESVDDELNAFDTAIHTFYGAQYRLWAGSLFVGAQAGVYGITLESDNDGSSTGSGPGYGLVIGLEGDGGLYLMLQSDRAEVAFDDADVKVLGQRLSLGFRFK